MRQDPDRPTQDPKSGPPFSFSRARSADLRPVVLCEVVQNPLTNLGSRPWHVNSLVLGRNPAHRNRHVWQFFLSCLSLLVVFACIWRKSTSRETSHLKQRRCVLVPQGAAAHSAACARCCTRGPREHLRGVRWLASLGVAASFAILFSDGRHPRGSEVPIRCR